MIIRSNEVREDSKKIKERPLQKHDAGLLLARAGTSQPGRQHYHGTGYVRLIRAAVPRRRLRKILTKTLRHWNNRRPLRRPRQSDGLRQDHKNSPEAEAAAEAAAHGNAGWRATEDGSGD